MHENWGPRREAQFFKHCNQLRNGLLDYRDVAEDDKEGIDEAAAEVAELVLLIHREADARKWDLDALDTTVMALTGLLAIQGSLGDSEASKEVVVALYNASPKMESISLKTRYIVLKLSDLRHAGLSDSDARALAAICERVTQYRAGRGKAPLKCAVVESDWDCYAAVVESILRGTAGSGNG
jgi:hypothetical protein